LRRAVARLRPKYREPFLRLETFPGEHYGEFCVMVRRRAIRWISCASSTPLFP
jgi:hypothetical protein